MNINNAFKFITSLCRQSYMQPDVVELNMRKHIELTDKYHNRLWTKIVLERLMSINVGTNDVQYHAFKQLRNMNVKNVSIKFRGLIHDSMKYKLGDAIENEYEFKELMIKANIDLKKAVNMNTLSGNEYADFLDKLWNKNWKDHKEKCEEKVKWLANKQTETYKNLINSKNIKYTTRVN